jgi:hypothetical protein
MELDKAGYFDASVLTLYNCQALCTFFPEKNISDLCQ